MLVAFSCVVVVRFPVFTVERYPITLADFLIADVTDSMLDGYIAGFPNTYASKVGKVRSFDGLLYIRNQPVCFRCRQAMLCIKVCVQPACSRSLGAVVRFLEEVASRRI